MSVVALVQARTSSARLPGKVLKPILGIPMILMQLNRIQRAKLIDEVIVTTSNHSTDDELTDLCISNKIPVFRGDLDNVLNRFVNAISNVRANTIVRLTGDCPLCDPEIIDLVISEHKKSAADYTSNALDPTFPDGLDVEVMKRTALEAAHKNAYLPSHLEHATPFIYQNPALFKLHSVQAKENNSHMRWTVDEVDDFHFVSAIYQNLYLKNPNFKTSDIYNLLELKPELQVVNSHIGRNEGFKKSLEDDKKFLSRGENK